VRSFYRPFFFFVGITSPYSLVRRSIVFLFGIDAGVELASFQIDSQDFPMHFLSSFTAKCHSGIAA